MKLPDLLAAAFPLMKMCAYAVLVAAVFCLPAMALLSSDDAPAAVVPHYLVSLSGLLCWCLLFLQTEVVLVRWGLAAAIASACFVCIAYATVVERHLRNREGITGIIVSSGRCDAI